jgi:hypothetical protein
VNCSVKKLASALRARRNPRRLWPIRNRAKPNSSPLKFLSCLPFAVCHNDYAPLFPPGTQKELYALAALPQGKTRNYHTEYDVGWAVELSVCVSVCPTNCSYEPAERIPGPLRYVHINICVRVKTYTKIAYKLLKISL